MVGFARRAATPAAAAVAMTQRARALRAEGADVVQLTLGEPDFDTPPHAIIAAHEAALRGDTKYPPQDGSAALKAAVRRSFERQGLLFDDAQVIVANGGKQVIFDAMLATVEDGDEVVIPAPYWSAYPLAVELLGGRPVFVPTTAESGFRPEPDSVEAAITERTRWLVLNSPNNPSGAVLSAADLSAIADVVRRYPHVRVLSDEMYAALVHDGTHASFAGVAPDLAERTLTVSGVSKTYAMTGWRIGFGAGPRDLIRVMAVMQGHATAGVSTVGQAAAAAALDGPQEAVAARAAIYRRRRDVLVEALNAIPGIACPVPAGAFYAFPSVAGCLGRNSAGGRPIDGDGAFAGALLEEQHLAVVPGEGFGLSPHIRISYAADEAVIAEGCRRLAAFVAGLR